MVNKDSQSRHIWQRVGHASVVVCGVPTRSFRRRTASRSRLHVVSAESEAGQDVAGGQQTGDHQQNDVAHLLQRTTQRHQHRRRQAAISALRAAWTTQRYDKMMMMMMMMMYDNSLEVKHLVALNEWREEVIRRLSFANDRLKLGTLCLTTPCKDRS